jgi:hypothetical protein
MDNPGMEGLSRRALALLVACVLVLGGVTALVGCGGSGGTTMVTSTVTSQSRPRAGHEFQPAGVSPGARRQADIRSFRHDAPKELQSVAACLADAGFGTPSLHPHDTYSGTGPYASASIETDAGSYEVAIFPKQDDAYRYVYQQTSYPGAGSLAVHGSYYGRVALYSEALHDNGIAARGNESDAYYAERTVVAACAFAIPAATGQPTSVY